MSAPPAADGARRPDLLERGLDPRARDLLRKVGERARARGEGVFLVGGAVRDLLRGDEHVDLDVTVVGDAGGLGEELAAAHGGTVATFPRFGTALYRHPALALDLASTRRETYPRPGARPEVVPDPGGLDLTRRDFTINAIAMDLSPEGWGTLVDPLGGIPDLEAGLLRILHPASFRDDPTRVLRGIRYHARLGVRFEEGTEALLREAVEDQALLTLDPDRLWRELTATLALGADVVEAVGNLHDLGVLASLGACFEPGPEDFAAVLRAARGQAALHAEGLRPKGAHVPFVVLLLGSTAARRARAGEVLEVPDKLRKLAARIGEGGLEPGPGLSGRVDPQGALALLALRFPEDAAFDREVERLLGEL